MLIPPLSASRVIGEPLRSLFFIIGKANLEGGEGGSAHAIAEREWGLVSQ
jgi:hypothetical protein